MEPLESRQLLAVVSAIDAITTTPNIGPTYNDDAALDTVTVGATNYTSVIPPVATNVNGPSGYFYAQNGTDPGNLQNALLSPNVTDFAWNIGNNVQFEFGQNLDGETFFVFGFGGGGEPMTAVPIDASGNQIAGDTALNPIPWGASLGNWTSNAGGTATIAGFAIQFQGVSGVEGIRFPQAGFSGSADIHVFASGTAAPPVVMETSVKVVSGNLIVTDINGGDTDDDLTFAVSGSDLIITDNNSNTIDLLGTLDGGAGDGTNSVTVPLSAFAGGGLTIDTKEAV